MKLVSIIMPSFNASSTILTTIGSVISQSYSNWELLIIDDCSTDNTLDVIRSIGDPRIQVHSLTVNSGSPATPRNVALDLSRGEYIAFLDADDLWKKDKLNKQIKFMSDNDIMFSCTAYNIIDVNGKRISTYTPPEKVGYNQLLTNNSIGCLTAVVRKELIENSYFPSCGHEDFSLWLKLIKKSKYIYGLNEKLACYRRLDHSASSNKIKLVYFFWHIYRNEEKYGIIKSLYLCFKYFINVMWFKYK